MRRRASAEYDRGFAAGLAGSQLQVRYLQDALAARDLDKIRVAAVKAHVALQEFGKDGACRRLPASCGGAGPPEPRLGAAVKRRVLQVVLCLAGMGLLLSELWDEQ